MAEENNRFAFVTDYWEAMNGRIHVGMARNEFENEACDGSGWGYGIDAIDAMTAAGECYCKYLTPDEVGSVDGYLVEFNGDTVASVTPQRARFSVETVYFIAGPDGDEKSYEVKRGSY